MTPQTFVKRAVFSALLGFAPGAAQSAVYVGHAYEGFNYAAPGTLTAANTGGMGWNANGDASANTAWSALIAGTTSIVAGSLSASNPYPASQGNRANPAAAGTTVGRIARDIGQNVDAGTFYFSVLMEKNNDTGRTVNFALMGDTTGTATSTEKIAVGQFSTPAAAGPGVFQAAVFNNANNATFPERTLSNITPISLGIDLTHLVIGRIDFNVSGALDRLRFYIDPGSANLALGENSLTPYIDSSLFDFGIINQVRLFAGANQTNNVAASADYDEIRLGSTFDQVIGAAVPEPTVEATLALGLIFVMGWCRLRQRA